MRACLCIGILRVLLQLKKKKENTAKRVNNSWNDDSRRAFLLGVILCVTPVTRWVAAARDKSFRFRTERIASEIKRERTRKMK